MPLIEMVDICKVYPPNVVALKHVDFSVEQGEIHALVGENGAGKSTLMKILSGIVKPSSGEIRVNDKKVHITNPVVATKLGIGMVHQELALVGSLKVYENIVLGSEPTRFGFLQRERSLQIVRKLMEEFGLKLEIDAITQELSIAGRQKVEILKQLYRRVNILILDEPTAALTPQESEELFDEMIKLKKQGKTIIFVSHKLDEVLKISDRITVLRKGEKIATLNNDGRLNINELAEMMVGRSVHLVSVKSSTTIGQPVLIFKDVTLVDRSSGKRLLDTINFVVREGEIVGIAGIEGNGQKELVEVLIGLRKPSSGMIEVFGKDVTNFSIRKRRSLIAYVPQDRKQVGLALKATIKENLIMTHHMNPPLRKGFMLDDTTANEFAMQLIGDFEIVCRGPFEKVQTLSGGNQQKVVTAREIALGRNLIVLDQPTRGLDVASTQYMRSQIISLKSRGKAVLLISADLDELMNLSDRIYVMRAGRIVAELDPRKIDKVVVGYHMLGVKV
ncbi:ABC transporter ATP-binding protein [Pseudothermotoga sp.]|uniref:ABC transporter ATP-binding protein n=1 Tax=Pseudothermotoga sp. TaxID=2033661 RepID=UPI0031F69B95